MCEEEMKRRNVSGQRNRKTALKNKNANERVDDKKKNKI